MCFSYYGSPPRAWGRRESVGPHCARTRFTPTSVGKTRGHHGRREEHAVHPHERGDDLCLTRRRRGFDGSPPRAWGRLRGQS